MASFNTSQSSANTMACNNVWPTNMVLLEAAKAKMPQHSEQLDDLVVLARIGMAHKKELEDEIGTWHLIHELEYEDSKELPTNPNTFRCIMRASEPYKKEALQRLWDLVNQGLEGKKKLDAMILQILEGTFNGDAYGATALAAPEQEDLHDYEKHGHITAEDLAEMEKEREEEAKNLKLRRYSLHSIQRLLGLMPPKELPAAAAGSAWTEEGYQEHCASLEDEEALYGQQEYEETGPSCHWCHPDSGCDGDHGDEMRDGFLLRRSAALPAALPEPWTQEDYEEHCAPQCFITEDDESFAQRNYEEQDDWCDRCSSPLHRCGGEHPEVRNGVTLAPTPSPLTVPQAQAQAQPNCGPSLNCSWPEFCRCGWQYHPLHHVLEFRDGTAKWDPSTEFWTWTSKHGVTHRHHFPSAPVPSTIQQSAAAYAEEVDQWAADLARLVAESKALRQAPLSAFASFDLGDDDVPMLDIEEA